MLVLVTNVMTLLVFAYTNKHAFGTVVCLAIRTHVLGIKRNCLAARLAIPVPREVPITSRATWAVWAKIPLVLAFNARVQILARALGTDAF